MIRAVRPPTSPFCEWLHRPQVQACLSDVRQYFFKVAPGNAFGLIIYSVKLARGTLAPELRRPISIGLAIGWALVALLAITLCLTAPPSDTMVSTIVFVLIFSFFAMVLVGTLMYNRVNYGDWI
ncbi:MAG: hypothetical protein AAB734_00055 [Patescibacteria group bacterium]